MKKAECKKSVYIVVSDDEQLRRDKVDELIHSLLVPTDQEQGLTHYQAVDVQGAEIVEKARTLPLFASQQVIIVHNSERLKKKALDVLATYAEHPADKTYIICEGISVGSDAAYARGLKEVSTVFILKQQTGHELQRVIMQRLKKERRIMNVRAQQLLIEKAGGSRAFLEKTLDYIILLTDEFGEITEEILTTTVGRYLSYDSYDLIDALCAKEVEKALTIMAYLFQEGITETETIALIGWQMRRLFEAKCLSEKKIPEREIGLRLKINAYFLTKFIRQMNHFTRRELIDIIEALYHADRRIKLGLVAPRSVVETLLISIGAAQFV